MEEDEECVSDVDHLTTGSKIAHGDQTAYVTSSKENDALLQLAGQEILGTHPRKMHLLLLNNMK